MKRKAVICLLLIALLVSFSMCGCGSYLRMMEGEIFEERIGSFFDALDNQDATMLKALFSQAVIDSDEDLDQQINKLFSVYPNAKTEILYDGLASSSSSRENGKYKSMGNYFITWQSADEVHEYCDIKFNTQSNVEAVKVTVKRANLEWKHYAIQEIQIFE